MKATIYTVTEKFAMAGTDGSEGYLLKAKTDSSARQEARKIAAAKGWEDYTIEFFRQSDGCRGTI